MSEQPGMAYFTPKWFIALLAGRFSFGDTFYAGMFGTGIIFVPAGFVIAALVAVVAPDTMAAATLWMTVFYAFYISALLPAILRTGLHSTGTGAWRWMGMLVAVVAVVALWWTAYSFFGAL